MGIRHCPKCRRLTNAIAVTCRWCGEPLGASHGPGAPSRVGPGSDETQTPRVPQTSPAAVLVLGILGVVLCGLLAPVAWSMGQNYENQCRSLGVQPDGSGAAGKILGMVGTILLGVGILLAMVLGVAVTGATSRVLKKRFDPAALRNGVTLSVEFLRPRQFNRE